MKEQTYFTIENKKRLETLSQILELSIPKTYYYPGYINKYENHNDFIYQNQDYSIGYTTAGLFRGQRENWDLIPSSYRSKNYDYINSNVNYFTIYDNHQFKVFSENASKQNNNFPKNTIAQMTIAQHYGIRTPLLDWSKNIFVAIYFALELKDMNERVKQNFEPYIYHIKDERLLDFPISENENILLRDKFALVHPLPIDRRIERQFSKLSFHPHPLINKYKIPVDEYRISKDIFMELYQLMRGLSYSSDYFFPDYAGLAERIKNDYFL